MDRKAHWNAVYAERGAENVSWFQQNPERSLALIRSLNLPSAAPIIDVGAGATRLLDILLDAGFSEMTALDVSAQGLSLAKARLGERAAKVHWIESDILEFKPPRRYALWHDRAVFHFLTDAAERRRYVETLKSSIAPNAHILIAAFAADGPEKCSGLPVQRYDAQLLMNTLGPAFQLLREESETHATPWDTAQRFNYFLLRLI